MFRPTRLTPSQLEAGYWKAYEDFYSWRNIARGARTHGERRDRLRHLAYAGGWRKFEPLWDHVIRSTALRRARPVLEQVLTARRA